ncbi:hypothetical protein GCM10023189_24970 [Nibrella saemangeumensis]|uniref:Uncharacterized protein n=1 Tax=Nibrella saemangeumensis TaxID=1084526 RepID=A0ABP8MVM9_9BACT
MAAFVSALLTGFGAGFAMRMVVLAALIGACLANFGAYGHKLPHKLGITGRQPATHGAEIGAFPAKPDALGHHLHMILFQAGGSAMFAGGRAIKTGVDVGAMFHSFHNVSWFLVDY